MKRFPPIVAVALTAVLAVLTPQTTANARPGTTSGTVPVTAGSITWGTCDPATLTTKYKVECGTVKVPLDWSKPNGTKITLAVSRLKHTSADSAYQGVLLLNPGGPGGSGLSLPTLANYVPNDAGATYDWIGFDPRGVGQSEPSISCDKYYSGFNRPPYVPTSSSIKRQWNSITYLYAQDCGRNNKGGILDHLTTVDSARDMNAIRQALGQHQLNYYGFSYGTYLGQVYSTLFPTRVRRQIFDGTVDPRGVWYDGNLGQDAPFDRNVNIWFGWLAKYDSVYHLGKTKKAVHDLFYATQKKLYAHPARGSEGLIGGDEWNDAFLWAGYYQSTWTDLATVFSSYVTQGKVGPLEEQYINSGGYGDDNGTAVYNAVQCTDVQWPISWQKWSRDNWRIYAKAPFETWGNAWFNAPCRHWPAKAHKPVTINGSKIASTLMINETLDAATPYSGSIEVRKLFPGARLVAEPGGTTHAGSLYGNACVDDKIAAYLATGTLPARKSGNRADVSCTPLPQPVPESSTASASPSAKSGHLVVSSLRKQIQQLSAPR